MRNVWAIYRRELTTYFTSPIAYVVLTLFIFIFGFFFTASLSYFIQYGFQMSQYGGPRTLNVNEHLIRGLLLNTSVLAIFMIPLITMRSMAEEKRSGTIELLLTSPITDLQIVLGKFLAASTLYAAMIGLTLVDLGFLFLYGDPEWKPLLAGYLGILLLGGSLIALGIFFSSLTRNQIIAGFLAIVAFLILWVVDFLESWLGPTGGAVVSYLSIVKHFEEFAKGVIDTKDVIYYLSFIGFGLFLSKQSLESHRWRG
jgi:ABC-2 type transport system permease protein